MIIADTNGKIIWKGDAISQDLDYLQELLDIVMCDGDLQIFTNQHVVCANPEIQNRLHCFPGHDSFEIERQRDIYERTRTVYGNQ